MADSCGLPLKVAVCLKCGFGAFIVWGIKKLVERGGSGTTTTEKRDPLDIAKERYTGGDISREEFEQMKKELS